MEKNDLERKKDDEDLWKMPQHKVGDHGIHLESATPHLLRTGSFCKNFFCIPRNTNILNQALIMVMSVCIILLPYSVILRATAERCRRGFFFRNRTTFGETLVHFQCQMPKIHCASSCK